MKGFVWSGIVLSCVFLASSLDASAGDRVKSSDLATSCNMVGYVNKPMKSHVFAGCCYESPGGGPISLEELFGDQLAPGQDGDKVAIWDVLHQNYTIYMKNSDGPVSYTHLTLPTNREV